MTGMRKGEDAREECRKEGEEGVGKIARRREGERKGRGWKFHRVESH